MLVIQINLALRARPILKLLARLLPELYSTRSNYYYLLWALLVSVHSNIIAGTAQAMWTKVVNIFSIITQVIIEILALSLAENGVIFHHNHLWWGDYLAGGQILKMAVSRFVDVSKEKMVSQQILTTVMTRIVVDKRTDHAKPHSICFLPQCQR